MAFGPATLNSLLYLGPHHRHVEIQVTADRAGRVGQVVSARRMDGAAIAAVMNFDDA